MFKDGIPQVCASGTIWRRNNQTPEFLARLVQEKHRHKLAKDGHDTH